MAASVRIRGVDLLALLVAGGFVSTFAIAEGVTKQEVMHRIKCASNLRQISMAITLYANENRGAYPRTTYSPGAPVWGTPYPDDGKGVAPNANSDPFADEKTAAKDVLAVKPKPNDVTAPLFLLLRTEDLVPEVFTCPSTTARRFDYDGKGAGALDYTNFPGKKTLASSLSYSYQNPYANADAIRKGFKLNNAIPAEFAVMADMNPGGDALLKLSPTDPLEKQRQGNSLNHRGDGQNVLFGDGHVDFESHPFAGQDRDNIYTAGGAEVGGRPANGVTIAASPVDASDSILLPTSADLGQDPHVHLPVTPGDTAALGKSLLGEYGSRVNGKVATLSVSATQLKMTSGPTTFTADYKVLGTRGDATVIELSPAGEPPSEAEVHLAPETLFIECDYDELNSGWVHRR